MPEDAEAQCLVIGGGPAGLATAAALATVGAEVVLVGDASPAAGAEDTRTAALLPSSVVFLQAIGAWEALAPASAPLAAIRLVDDTGGLLRAPEVLFEASEIGWPDLGHNIPNAALADALRDAARRAGVHIVADKVAAVETGSAGATARLRSGGEARARLVVGADGRESLCRTAAGIEARRWSYDQVAVATRFRHSRPHRSVSTEIHRAAGPCTTVPLPDDASSLVWVERPAAAEQLMALGPAEFLERLTLRLGGLLGALGELGPRRSFPLSGLAAASLARNRIALVGEAAHVIPPIGAQGLNLGLLDAAALADCVAAARVSGADPGGPDCLAAYAAARQADMRRRIGAVDMLNRSLITGLLPVSLVRGAGLHLLASSGALRRRLMLEGLQPLGPLPSLMRHQGAWAVEMS